MKTYVNHFNTAYNAVAKKDITIPKRTRAFILVQKAVIDDETK